MIYAIIPFRDESGALDRKLKELKERDIPIYDDEAPNAYFAAYKGTTRELAEVVGYGDSSVGTGVVIPVSNYYGYASKHLWEWLSVHGKDG